jgi:hypothetical protein
MIYHFWTIIDAQYWCWRGITDIMTILLPNHQKAISNKSV